MDNTTVAFLLSFLSSFFLLMAFLNRRHRHIIAVPPSPKGKLPIIGHLHHLTGMPHHTFSTLAADLGPIFLLQLGHIPTLIISSSHLARAVLKTHDHVFANRPQLVSAKYLSFNCSDVTFSKYGPYWRQVRRICVTEILSPKRVASFEKVRHQEVLRMTDKIKGNFYKLVDVSGLLFGMANDILCMVAFGRRFGEKGRLVEVMTETQALFAGFCVGDFFPRWEWVNWVSGYRGRLLRNLKDLRGVCDEIIREHEDDGRKKMQEEDFVDVLLRVRKSQNLEVPIDDDNLKALVLDMFVAGTDTTSSTLEWAMSELTKHPKAMKKASTEVREAAVDEVRETHIQNLRYLKSVIKETLRLHPPAPLLVPRESMEDCVLGEYHIKKGTRVLINAYAIGRDSGCWENPLEFDPDRFLGDCDATMGVEDFRFLAFGGGRRGCPGSGFGLATVELALARLLFHFDWALPEGTRSEDIDMGEVFGLASRKKTPLLLVPIPTH